MKKKGIYIILLALVCYCLVGDFGGVEAYAKSSLSDSLKWAQGLEVILEGSKVERLPVQISEMEDVNKLIKQLMEVEKGEKLVTLMKGKPVWMSYIKQADEQSIGIARMMNQNTSWLQIGNVCYEDNKALDDLYNALMKKYTSRYTVDCKAPKTKGEYTQIAERLFAKWMTNYTGNKVSPYYRMNNMKLDRVIFTREGYYNGRKEFTVEVAYSGKPQMEHSYFETFYKEGSYCLDGSYWSGYYTRMRFAYDEGQCALVEISDRTFGESDLDYDLNRITENSIEPITFENLYKGEAYDKNRDMPVYIYSYNEVRMADGRRATVAIGCDDREIVNKGTRVNEQGEKVSTVTGEMRDYMGIEGVVTYNSPVYYYDETMSGAIITYDQAFSLIFEDYNGDHNPDYLLKYKEEDKGSWYSLETLEDRGIIAYQTDVFVADCYADTILLEKVAENTFRSYDYNKLGQIEPVYYNQYGKTDFDDSKLPIYNSQVAIRYNTSPKGAYTTKTQKIELTLWNHSNQPIQVSGNYTLEKNVGGTWKNLVTKGAPLAAGTVRPRGYIKQSVILPTGKEALDPGYYRIVQKINEKEASYADFYIRGSSEMQAVLVPNASSSPCNSQMFSFGLSNTWIDGFYYNQRPRLEVYKDSKWQTIDCDENYYFKNFMDCRAEESVTYDLRAEMFKKALVPGNYRLSLKARNERGEEKWLTTEFKLSEKIDRNYKNLEVNLKVKGNLLEAESVEITIKNQSWNKEDIILDARTIVINAYIAGTPYMLFYPTTQPAEKGLTLAYGESLSFTLDFNEFDYEERQARDAIAEYGDVLDEMIKEVLKALKEEPEIAVYYPNFDKATKVDQVKMMQGYVTKAQIEGADYIAISFEYKDVAGNENMEISPIIY